MSDIKPHLYERPTNCDPGFTACAACGFGVNATVHLIAAAILRERERCARICEAWAASQDRAAVLKAVGAPCSAESHRDSAWIGRRYASLIRGGE